MPWSGPQTGMQPKGSECIERRHRIHEETRKVLGSGNVAWLFRESRTQRRFGAGVIAGLR
jgi:hypothetical protein